MEKIVLVGGGGHCKVVIDVIIKSKKFEIFGIVDPKPKSSGIPGLKFIGDDSTLIDIFQSGCKNAFITVGSIGEPSVRIKLAQILTSIGFNLPIIIHPSAVIAKGVNIEVGVFIGAAVVIGPDTNIGKNAIINTKVSIDHDCKIGDFVHLAPGVTLCGGVEVGAKSHIGSGASIIEYKKIGAETLIGAGSVVTSDIPAKCKAFGNPCKVIEQKNE